MNLRRRLVAIVASSLLFAGCAGLLGPSVPPPPAEGQQVHLYLQQADYTSWPLWPGKEAKRPSAVPHGATITTHLNTVASKALKKGLLPLPPGAMIVTDNFGPDGTLAFRTLMYKQDGYNPAAGDWYWAQINADGKIRREGKVTYCLNCHQRQRDRDYILGSF